MPAVVLATINARYIHSAFGLRYLAANLGERTGEAKILEFTAEKRAVDIAEELLAEDPRILGLGIYIWNALESLELVTVLRRVAPDLTIVLGGPEISFETEQQPIAALADYIVCGEGEAAFRDLCERVLEGRRPLTKRIEGGLPELGTLTLPYHLYTDRDIATRVVYVEASRGCPYKCEFCLSSLDTKVRAFPIDKLLASLQSLLDRGARRFKFVDRTFNLDMRRSEAILSFFLERIELGLFLHFEMVPDRLPAGLRKLIAQFPAGSLQFEVGVQTLDPAVGERISRRQDLAKMQDNLEFLRAHTGVHLHTDLIVGLPGESIEGFGAGFDRLVDMGVQEIQVGILKRLRGTPIVRHDAEFGMVYDVSAPYEVLQTGAIDFGAMQRLKRFAQVWNHVRNEGDFRNSALDLWSDGSPFWGMLAFSDWLFRQAGRVHAISLKNLSRYLLSYLVKERGHSEDTTRELIQKDFELAGRKHPGRLDLIESGPSDRTTIAATPPRQSRHAADG
jgi:radical SAM superfamily enzyme YgiQ (UPF0313 family)